MWEKVSPVVSLFLKTYYFYLPVCMCIGGYLNMSEGTYGGERHQISS